MFFSYTIPSLRIFSSAAKLLLLDSDGEANVENKERKREGWLN